MNHYGQGNELDMLEDALEAGGMAWWVMELPSGVVFFSPNKIRMLGYTEKDVSKFVHYSNFTDIVHPEDFEKCMKTMRDHIEGKASMYETQYRIKHVDGSYIKLYDRGRIVGRKGSEITVAGIVLNITNTKGLERAA